MEKNKRLGTVLLAAVSILAVALAMPRQALAHCDTLDGPVITDARLALQKGDVTPVLKWVMKENEPEVRAAFTKALAVRSKGPEAKELADNYFFETLVRIHRAGEGAPYTGLAPAGAVEPIVKEADRALETGSADALARELAGTVETGVRTRFAKVAEARKHADESVAAGREFVAAYVQYVHYAEGLQAMAAGPGGHAHADAQAAQEHQHGEAPKEHGHAAPAQEQQHQHAEHGH
ncbi:MAG: DUF6448 family protein [bacterium]